MSTESENFVLTLSCPDAVGIVAEVTGCLAAHGFLITDAQHHRETGSDSTVLRVVFQPSDPCRLDFDTLRRHFHQVAQKFGMTWQIRRVAERLRVLVAVSKQSHCLNSLLHRWSVGTLPVDVVAVVSNHETQRRLAEWHGLPFHFLPIDPRHKERQETQVLALFERYRADLLVLARYMQILSAHVCRQLKGRAINIHHSFLPGFKGANPYQQAFRRGVKLIGATAHYVNEELDEGPIIEQAVERVDHTLNVDQLTTIGNEIESVVLNRAVQWHAEHRIFEFKGRTVVLR
jgi:formyltetrahydrofolate deformylase